MFINFKISVYIVLPCITYSKSRLGWFSELLFGRKLFFFLKNTAYIRLGQGSVGCTVPKLSDLVRKYIIQVFFNFDFKRTVLEKNVYYDKAKLFFFKIKMMIIRKKY
jgi:hypothetical protein